MKNRDFGLKLPALPACDSIWALSVHARDCFGLCTLEKSSSCSPFCTSSLEMEPQKLQSKAWSASDLVSAASTVVDMAAPALSTVLAQEHELLEQEQKCQALRWLENPIVDSCQIDESFAGITSKYSRRVSPKITVRRTYDLYLTALKRHLMDIKDEWKIWLGRMAGDIPMFNSHMWVNFW